MKRSREYDIDLSKFLSPEKLQRLNELSQEEELLINEALNNKELRDFIKRLEELPKDVVVLILTKYGIKRSLIELLCKISKIIRRYCNNDIVMKKYFYDGILWGFGNGKYGQLGDGKTGENHNQLTPKKNQYFIENDIRIKKVSCGKHFTAVITTDGNLYTFGSGKYGKLGRYIEDDDFIDSFHIEFPYLIDFFSKTYTKIEKVSTKWEHVAAIDNNGYLFMWGYGEYGILGDGGEDFHNRSLPDIVDFNFEIKVKKVSCGKVHTAVISDNGNLYTFGSGDYGQLGDGLIDDHVVRFPYLVEYFKDIKIIKVSCGWFYTAVISDTGKLYTFGHSNHGQLGDGINNFHSVSLPYLVEYFKKNNIKIIKVSCGRYHTAVISKTGGLYTFGHGKNGELGTGDTKNRSTPYNVRLTEPVKSVSCGSYYTLIASKTQNVYVFGRQRNGLLGNNKSDGILEFPTLLPIPYGVKSVSAGTSHSFIISEARLLKYEYVKSKLFCLFCKTKNSRFLCKSCNVADYCSKECQKNDWKRHHKICNNFKIK